MPPRCLLLPYVPPCLPSFQRRLLCLVASVSMPARGMQSHSSTSTSKEGISHAAFMPSPSFADRLALVRVDRNSNPSSGCLLSDGAGAIRASVAPLPARRDKLRPPTVG